MYHETKRRDVRLLLAAEVPQKRIAPQLGVPLRTVQPIARKASEAAEAARGASGGSAGARAGPGRPSVVAAYRDTVRKLLRAEPGMKSLEVLRRLRKRGYRGGKSAVYALARELRRQSTRPVCRCEGVAGEFS